MSWRVFGLEALRAVSERLASPLSRGGAAFFSGPLGAGKTTMIRFICEALGVTQPVTSPSFDLLHIYHTERLTIYHVDGYRLDHMEDWDILDLPVGEPDTVLLAEWADMVKVLYPRRLEVSIALSDRAPEERVVTVAAVGMRWEQGGEESDGI
ncbi:MAG: tRNA (adenosine(37)-N6)-threonylcarbamoyltransferase complex ATPase subunit type 1 TsaE [Firmicutes bacterium]|nr:tRNA (adenosine(37)-N6)-threonylcarbamoyltransferase complex ATPase subunit type 1 TsaE [Bacillota bacterium]